MARTLRRMNDDRFGSMTLADCSPDFGRTEPSLSSAYQTTGNTPYTIQTCARRASATEVALGVQTGAVGSPVYWAAVIERLVEG